ncbi:hypothetical protein B0H19DRAFT_1198286 [Mycena capillaripes]|nr:hypothetical protein B0H19DRAFT_1198286 [Mycena capillaripes]
MSVVGPPADRLPAELLMEIFSECCFDRYPIDASVPMCLSHVCARWRALTLSMPTLWASFSIKVAQLSEAGFGVQNSPRNEIISRLLHLHLERSARCPLSFDVDFNKAEMSPAALNLVGALVEHSDRWANVKLPFSSVFAPLFARLSGRLGSLESLDLRLHGNLDHSEGAHSTYFEVAPQLRRLALGASLPRKMPFPKNQLTELHLGAAPTMDMFQFMTLCPCPHLTTLVLNPYYPLKLPAIPRPLPTLMHLHTIILAIRDGYSRNPVMEVLDLLTAPSLQNLEVVGVREIQLPRQAFASFLERSGCTLRTLTIAFKDNLLFPALLSNLRAVSSSLTHLIIFARGKEEDIVDHILQALTLPDAVVDDHLLPNLASFQLQASSFHPELLDFVASRIVYRPDCLRLQNLILHNTPNTKAARQRLQSFLDQGLIVSYRRRYKPSRATLFI